MNIATLIARAAQKWPHAIALIDHETKARWTFDEFVRATFAFGSKLLALGLAPGQRVALLADATPDYLFADYGAMSAGLVRVPLDPALSAPELAAQLLSAGAGVLLYAAQYEVIVEAIREAWREQGGEPIDCHALEPFWQAAASAEVHAIPAPCPADAVASLNFSGGTTGMPKAIVHRHGSLCAALQNIVMVRAMGSGDVMINVRPLWPIAAIVVLAHLIAGGTVVLGGRARFSPARLIDLLGEYGAATTSLVPTHLVRLLREIPAVAPTLPQLRCIDIGAAAVPPEILAQAIGVFGSRFATIYGLTEAPWSCYRSPREVPGDGRDDLKGMVGRPAFSSEIRIVDERGESLENGSVGEVWIRGPQVMAGYLDDEALNREVLVDGWLRTGDLGELDDRGCLYIRGRLKDLIRSGGKSVQPTEVEDVLRRHAAVADVAVVGLADPEWGEIVAAAVVLNERSKASVEELTAYCRDHLSAHKRPRRLRLIDELPRSHYGKIQQNKLRELLFEY